MRPYMVGELAVTVPTNDGPPNPALRSIPGGDKPTQRLHRIAGMGPLVRAHFVQLLKQNAWTELDRQAHSMPQDRYRRLEGEIMEKMTAGRYEWGEEVHQQIDGTEFGGRMILLARLRACSPNASMDDVEAILKEHGWKRVAALQNEADGPRDQLPNSPAPEPSNSGDTQTTKPLSPGSSEPTQGQTPKSSEDYPTD